MKHEDIIGTLNGVEKVALISGLPERETLEGAGLPDVGLRRLDGLARRRGISYGSAARSWDPALIAKMTEELVSEAGAEGGRLFVTPDIKTAIDPRGEGLSEDPELCGELGAAIVRGVKGAGGAVTLSRLAVTKEDAAQLDLEENAGAIRELVAKPLLRAAREGCDGLELSPARGGAGYRDTNRALFFEARGGQYGKETFLFADRVDPTPDAVSLLQPNVILGGAKLPLERAARRYRQLDKYLKEGSMTEHEAEEAVHSGVALDDARLNEAADAVADFALRVSALTPAENMGEEGRRALSTASFVLLKNDILPLAKGAKLAVVGDPYDDLSALSERFEITGTARGYERLFDRSDALIPDAVRSTEGADAVLLFLHPDPSHRTFALPANRIALIEALRRAKRKLIALVVGDRPADMSFDGAAAAVLAVPEDGPFAGEALAKILTGEEEPSGRLTRTCYDNADERFRALADDRANGRVKVGSFIGYFRYTTSGERVRYPFGFGLGYTKFAYSKLTVNGDNISFTLKNVGKRAGSEVVQLYIGAPSGTRIVPEKQLRAFAKIYLNAGESRQVSFSLPPSAYATYDADSLSYNVETGSYRVLVCSSSLDVKLAGRRNLEGTVRTDAGEHAADYFRDGDRDVAAEGAKKETAPKSLKIARRAALCSLPVLAVIFFLIATSLAFTYAYDMGVLFIVDAETAKWLLYVLAVVVFAVIPLLVGLNRKKLALLRAIGMYVCPFLLFGCIFLGVLLATEDGGEAEETVLLVLSCLTVAMPLMTAVAAIIEYQLKKYGGGSNRWEKYYFEPKKEETEPMPEAAFEEAFRAAEEARASKPQKKEAPKEPPPPDVPQFYDRSLTYAVMLSDGRKYAEERGVVASEEALSSYLAALVSARLILMPAGKGVGLASVLSGYFGAPASVDNAELYYRGDDLFTAWREMERANVKTGFYRALLSSKEESAYLHTVIIRHLDAARAEAVLGDLAEAIACHKTELDFRGENIPFPKNLRIVAEIEGEAALPASLTEVAAVLSLETESKEPAEKKTRMQTVGFERFSSLSSAVRDEYPLGEDSWKAVDSLDDRCSPHHIGNLLWVKTEMHASVLLALGASEQDALAGAADVELLPWVNGIWEGDKEELSKFAAGLFKRSDRADKAGRKKK